MILVYLDNCPICNEVRRHFPDWVHKSYSKCSVIEINFIQKQMKKYKMNQFPVAYNKELTRFYNADDLNRLLSVFN